MAIAIDKMAYSDDCNNELLFEYLYHLSMMLAVKACYFKSAKHYDDFAIFMASSAYFRLKNPKQYIYDSAGQPKMSQLKSILNYLKAILYPRKVAFEQENYAQTDIILNEDENVIYVGHTFANRLSDSVDDLVKVDFKCCLEDCCNLIKEFLKKIPYKYNSNEWNNIYISCLLSFLNSIIISRNDLNKINSAKYNINDHFLLLREYDRLRKSDYVVLFHLEDNMKDYIKILVSEIKHLIAKDLSESLHTEINTSNMTYPMVKAEINGLAKSAFEWS